MSTIKIKINKSGMHYILNLYFGVEGRRIYIGSLKLIPEELAEFIDALPTAVFEREK